MNIRFYGLRILLVSVIAICFGYSGVIIFGFSAFIIPLTEEFGWSRADISLAYTLCMFSMILSISIVGLLLDRFGVRLVLLISTTFFSLLLCSLYFLTGSLWHLNIIFILIPILGGATSIISYSRLIVSWFEKYTGLALGISMTGVGISAAIIPFLVQTIIQLSGWREAYLFFGIINLFICLPILYLTIKNTPEEVGTFPDGEKPTKDIQTTNNLNISNHGYSFKECLRQTRFWKLLFIFFLFAMSQTGPFAQIIPILVSKGFSQADAAGFASYIGFALIFSRIFAGFLMDRFFAPYVASIFLIVPVIGLTTIVLSTSHPQIAAAMLAISLGVAIGVEFDVMAFFCTQYFGRLSYGRTYGVMFAVFNLGAGLGMYLTGAFFDHYSSYDLIMLAGAGTMTVAVCMLLTMGPYPELPIHKHP